MPNILLEIEYDGTNYSGWQAQGHKVTRSQGHKLKTIQETIENTLQKILQEKIKLIASGRTDAGVHAKGQVANFKTKSRLPLSKIKLALNSLLPRDILIKSIKQIPADFHSRYSAKLKLYRYTILNRDYSDVFLYRYVWYYPYKLNINLMKNQAKALLGRHNFKSFQASDRPKRNSIRTIKRLSIKKEKDFIYFDIESDGFLYKMVRNIVGTLVEIGSGKPTELVNVLGKLDRKDAGPTAPACGLCLIKVKYAKSYKAK